MNLPPQDRIEVALELAQRFGSIHELHHKTWLVDQMVRALTGNHYPLWVYRHNAESDDRDLWEVGTPP